MCNSVGKIVNVAGGNLEGSRWSSAGGNWERSRQGSKGRFF